jgi:hypothetical protein
MLSCPYGEGKDGEINSPLPAAKRRKDEEHSLNGCATKSKKEGQKRLFLKETTRGGGGGGSGYGGSSRNSRGGRGRAFFPR